MKESLYFICYTKYKDEYNLYYHKVHKSTPAYKYITSKGLLDKATYNVCDNIQDVNVFVMAKNLREAKVKAVMVTAEQHMPKDAWVFDKLREIVQSIKKVNHDTFKLRDS